MRERERERERDNNVAYTYIHAQKSERNWQIFTVDRGLFSSYKIQRSVGGCAQQPRPGRGRDNTTLVPLDSSPAVSVTRAGFC
jgi:hypothetical protein